MSYVVGQRITRFWNGEKYIFERTDNGNWKCVHQDTPIIPYSIIEELETL
jgi:ketosteroid isomerase-like protein